MGKNLNSYRNGTKIKSVSISPRWMLWFRGWADSDKGVGVANAHVQLFLDKCTELEALECLSAEELLHDTRKRGADALATIKENTELLSNFPGLVEENGPLDVRENMRRQSSKRTAEKEISEAKRSLFTFYEIITNGDTVLHERIIKTRKKAASLIDAYVKGLRSGKLKDFEADMSFSDRAVEDYHSRHKKSDDAISRYATVFEEGEKTA